MIKNVVCCLSQTCFHYMEAGDVGTDLSQIFREPFV